MQSAHKLQAIGKPTKLAPRIIIWIAICEISLQIKAKRFDEIEL